MRARRSRDGWSGPTRHGADARRRSGGWWARSRGTCGWAAPGAPCRPAGRRGGPCTAGSGAGSSWACSTPCCGTWRAAGGARAGGGRGRRRPSAARRRGGGPPRGGPPGGGRRRKGGRRPGPTLAIVDTQAVRCIAVRGPRGCDAAKGVVGRERVALVDAEGHRLAVAVVPASVQDRDTLEALDAGKARWPSLREGVYDGAFAAERCREWSNVHGMRPRVVTRDPAARGFVVLARRWVVERSFGWLPHGGGLAKDRAGRLDVSAARLALVGILSGFEALLNPMPARAPAQ